MSCNIIEWKTKRLESLQIPVKEMFYHERKDWHPEIAYYADGSAVVKLCESGGITGEIKNGILFVSGIELTGECSGNAFYYVLNHAFSKSTGILEAVRVWESGEIDRIKVDNGQVVEEPIEL
jgi:hypothetical protein